MKIKFNINLTIQDKRFDRIINFNKELNYDLDVREDLIFGQCFELDKKYILDYFSEEMNLYEYENNLNSSLSSTSDLIIDEFEVVASSKEYEVFFEADNDATYNFDPSLKVFFYEKEIELKPIQITGSLISKNAIKIEWPEDEFAHIILDEKLQQIYECGIGESQYIETDLSYDIEYTRYVISTDGNKKSDLSNVFTFKTEVAESEPYDVKPYEEISNFDFVPEEDENNIPLLKAFQSGVGFENDCKIYKGDIGSFSENIPLNFTIEGAKDITVRYKPKVVCGYRYKVKAKYKEIERDGYLNIDAEAHPVENVKVRLYSYGIIPLTVKWKITAKVCYIVKEGSNYVSYTRNLSKESEYVLDPNDMEVLYFENYAKVKPVKKNIVNNVTIGSILAQEASKISNFSSAIAGHTQYFDIRIYDNCYADCDELYTPSDTFKEGHDGTLRIGAEHCNKPSISDSIFVQGYSNAILYTKEIIKEVEITGGEDEIAAFSNEELNSLYKCENNKNITIPFSSLNKKITLFEILVTNHNVVSNNKDNNMFLKVKSSLIAKDKKFNFNLSNPNNIINYYDLFSMPSGYDKFKKYKFSIYIKDCSSSITYKNNLVYSGDSISEISTMAECLTFESRSYLIEKEFEEVYPPLQEECMHVLINGKDDSNILIHNGRNDIVEIAHKFSLDYRFYDIKYSIEIDQKTIKPKEATVSAYYPSTGIPESSINGDSVVFTSDFETTSVLEKKEIILSRSIYCSVEENGGKIKRSINIVSNTQEYKHFSLSVYSPIKDIVIDFEKNISPIAGVFFIDVSLKLIKHPKSKWYPLVNNGYYYKNQEEYFLCSGEPPNSSNQIITEKIQEEYVLFNIVVVTNENIKLFHEYSYKVLMDEEEHVLSKDIQSITKKWFDYISLKMTDVKSMYIDCQNENIDLLYNIIDGKINGPISAKSKEKKVIIDLTGEYNINTTQFFLSPTPKQFSPIMIESEKYGVLKYINNLSDDENILCHKEIFDITKDNIKTLSLEYSDVDCEKVTVTKEGEEITLAFRIISNFIIFEEPLPVGPICVRYFIKNSFTASFDEINNRVKIYTNTETPIGKSIISYETADNSKKVLTHLSLNPVHNIDYSGFIYIDDKEYEPKEINILIEPNFLFAGTKDYSNLFIQVTDINKNPVEGVFVSITSNFDNILCDNSCTDRNGIVAAICFAPDDICDVEITVTCNEITSSKIIKVKRRGTY